MLSFWERGGSMPIWCSTGWMFLMVSCTLARVVSSLIASSEILIASCWRTAFDSLAKSLWFRKVIRQIAISSEKRLTMRILQEPRMLAIFCSWADFAEVEEPAPIQVAVWKRELKAPTTTPVKTLKSLSFDMSYGLMKLSPWILSVTTGMISLLQENFHRMNMTKMKISG